MNTNGYPDYFDEEYFCPMDNCDDCTYDCINNIQLNGDEYYKENIKELYSQI